MPRCMEVGLSGTCHVHCARWGPSFPSQQERGHSPQFSAHVYCGQTAVCIRYGEGLRL